MKIHEVLAGILVGTVTSYALYDVIARLNTPVDPRIFEIPFGGTPPVPYLLIAAMVGLMALIWLVYPKDEVPA